MPEVRQRAADPYGEIRGESGAAVLGMLSVSEVQDDAELIEIGTAKNRSLSPNTCTRRVGSTTDFIGVPSMAHSASSTGQCASNAPMKSAPGLIGHMSIKLETAAALPAFDL